MDDFNRFSPMPPGRELTHEAQPEASPDGRPNGGSVAGPTGVVDAPQDAGPAPQAMPSDALVSSFQGSRANPGTVNIAGTGSDQNITARWIEGLARVDAIATLWVPSANKPGGPHQDVTFTSTATLTPTAQSTGRVDQYIGGAR